MDPRRTGNGQASRQQAEMRGRQAEFITMWLYRLAGWRLIAHRQRTPYGEIDLIMSRFNCLVFIEVKWRARRSDLAEMMPGPRQLQRLRTAIGAELARRSAGRSVPYSGRFDLVCWSGVWPASWLRQIDIS